MSIVGVWASRGQIRQVSGVTGVAETDATSLMALGDTMVDALLNPMGRWLKDRGIPLDAYRVRADVLVTQEITHIGRVDINDEDILNDFTLKFSDEFCLLVEEALEMVQVHPTVEIVVGR